MNGDITITDDGAIRYVQFGRPDKLNAMRKQDLIDIRLAVQQVPEHIAVLVLRGNGEKAFTAGMDIATFVGIARGEATTDDVIGEVRNLLDAVRTSDRVTIAAVAGYCLGAGFELALACDLRVVTDDSLLGLPEMNLGLPCILDSAVLGQYVGLSLAKEMMLTGDLYTTEQLQHSGMFNAVVSRDQLQERVSTLAGRLATKPRPGVASQKRLFELWQNAPLHTSNDICLQEIGRVFDHPDTKQAILALGNTHARA